jgi:hypothetical protein
VHAENIDLPVTIAKLLNLPFTGDGKVITAALQN